MGKILDSSYSNVVDGQKLDAADLKQDRSVIRIAVNDNQDQLYRMWFGEDHNLVFDTKADLDAFASPVDLEYAVVLTDEEQADKSTFYQYQTNAWVIISTNYSLKGVVTGEILDVYMLKETYDSTDSGIVDKAESVDDGTFSKSAEQIAKGIFDALRLNGDSDIGKAAWDGTYLTWKLSLDANNDLRIGQMGVELVLNNTGSTINKGIVGYLSGSSGTRTTVGVASNDDQAKAHATIGIINYEITNNQEGFIKTKGLIENIDTSHLIEGGTVWLGLNGLTTSVEPVAPSFKVELGLCVRSHLSLGSILINVEKVHKISEASDVIETAVSAGDMLVRDTTNLFYENRKLNFAELADTPSEIHVDDHHKGVRVNGAGDALEFYRTDNNSMTSIISGFVMSINVDTTKFDIALGEYKTVESVTNGHPFTTISEFAGELAVSALNIATEVRTYVGIDVTGTVITQNVKFTPTQLRSIARIGYINHPMLVIVETVTKPITADQFQLTINDFHPDTEVVDGNVFAAAAADLTIKVSGGNVKGIGINYEVNTLSPNIKALASLDPITFTYFYRDGAGSLTMVATQTDIVPNFWDDDSGTLQELTLPANNNKATVQGLYRIESSGDVGVLYGQEVFDSVEIALQAVDRGNITFDVPDVFLDNKIFRGYLIVRAGGTDLSNEDDAVFKAASIGGVGTGGGATGSLNDDDIINTSVIATLLARGADQQLVNESFNADIIQAEADIVLVKTDVLELQDEILAPDDIEVFYAGETGSYATDKDGTPHAIDGEVTTNIETAKGLTVNQLIDDGNFASGITNVTVLSQCTIAKVGDDLEITATGTSPVISILVDTTSVSGREALTRLFVETDITATKIETIIDGSTGGTNQSSDSISNPTVDTIYELVGITTENADFTGNLVIKVAITSTTIGSKTLIKGLSGVMYIPITNNAQLNTLTAEQISSRIPLYIEGINSIENLNIDSTDKQLFDKSKVILDKYIDQNGVLQTSASYVVSPYIPIKNNIDYYSLNIGAVRTGSISDVIYYDIDFNILGNVEVVTNVSKTFQVPNGVYIRYSLLTTNYELEQLELGTVGTTFKEFTGETSNLVVRGTMRSVGDVYDTPELQSVELDFNDVVKSSTGWALDNDNGTTIRAYINLQSSLLYPDDNMQGILVIDNVDYPVVISSSMSAGDTIGFSVLSSLLRIRILKSNLSTLDDAGMQAYLQSVNVHFEYELATPIPQELDIDGAILSSVDATFVQSSDNGLNNIFSVIQAENFRGRVDIMDKRILDNNKEIKEVAEDLDTAEDRITVNEGNIGTNVTAIGLNTTHRGSSGLEHSQVTINKTNADASKLITDKITLTENINLNKVTLNNTKIDLSDNALTNITITETIANFVSVDITIRKGDLSDEHTVRVFVPPVGSITRFTHKYERLSLLTLLVDIEIIGTTLSIGDVNIRTLVLGATASITDAGNSDYDFIQIIGNKY